METSVNKIPDQFNTGPKTLIDDTALLAKLEEANRLLETDSKSTAVTFSNKSSLTNGRNDMPDVSNSSTDLRKIRSDSRTSSLSSSVFSFIVGNGVNNTNNANNNNTTNSNYQNNSIIQPLTQYEGEATIDTPSVNTRSKLIEGGAALFTSLSSSLRMKSSNSGPPIAKSISSSSTSTFDSPGVISPTNEEINSEPYLNENNVDRASYDNLYADNESLWAIWSKIIKEWDTQSDKNMPLIRNLILKHGIPGPFRALAWQLLSGATGSRNDSTNGQRQDPYPNVKPVYAEYLKLDSPYEKLIRRDINRTYPEHTFFKDKDSAGQESLFNVMKAYSLLDQEVGYCQGSCFIVGMLLMQMPEEEAFAVLTKIMHKYNMRKLFKPCMSDLALCMYQLECLIQDYIPDLYRHFQENNFHASLYASPWFLTLFSSSLPLDTAFRIMDVFLLDGLEVVFKVGAAILHLSKNDLFALDMESMLQYFQRDIPLRLGSDPDVLFHVAFSSASACYNDRKMKRHEKDFTTIRVKEHDELAQIKKLRQENRLLKQRVTYLEQESASLADRLIQGQVSRATQAEEHISVKRDFHELRKVLNDKDQSLQMALDQIRTLKTSHLEDSENIEERNEEMIETLQQELLAVKYREAECKSNLIELTKKYDVLENEYRAKIKDNVNGIDALKNDLNLHKLKDVESGITIKDLQQKIAQLKAHWQDYLISTNGTEYAKKMDQLHLSLGHNDSLTPSLSSLSNINELTSAVNDNYEYNGLPRTGCDIGNINGNAGTLANGNAILHRDSVQFDPITSLDNSTSISLSPVDIESLRESLCKKDKDYLKPFLDILMGLRLSEALAFAEVRDLKIQMVEMQSQVNSKIKTNESLNQTLQFFQEKYDEYLNKDTDSQNKLKSLGWEISHLKSQLQERDMILRLRQTELMERQTEARGNASRLATEWSESFLNSSLATTFEDNALPTNGTPEQMFLNTSPTHGDGGDFNFFNDTSAQNDLNGNHYHSPALSSKTSSHSDDSTTNGIASIKDMENIAKKVNTLIESADSSDMSSADIPCDQEKIPT